LKRIQPRVTPTARTRAVERAIQIRDLAARSASDRMEEIDGKRQLGSDGYRRGKHLHRRASLRLLRVAREVMSEQR
jgi:hypothetical protein